MNETISSTSSMVSLSLPCQAEFVGVARLAILGVASRMNFSYDEVEDLRLAVGEACTGAIDRAKSVGDTDATVRIDCLINNDELTIEVKDANTGGAPEPAEAPEFDPDNISALLMEILVDSVDVTEQPGVGTTVRLVKKVHLQ